MVKDMFCVLQRFAVLCNVLQSFAVYCSTPHRRSAFTQQYGVGCQIVYPLHYLSPPSLLNPTHSPKVHQQCIQ